MNPAPATASTPPKPRKKRPLLWLTLCSVAALSAGAVVVRKEIAAGLVQGWLKGQGATADVHFDQLNLKHLSGRINFGREASVRRFEADYHLGFGKLTLTRMRVVHPVGQLSYRYGKLSFGQFDTLVHNLLTAKPSGGPPPHEIIVEDADIRIMSDYGLIRTHGGLSLHDGRLNDLRLYMPPSALDGTLGEGEAVSGLITARIVQTAQNGEQLQIEARLTADNIDVRSDAKTPVNADHQKTHLQGVTLTLNGLLPYRRSKAIADAFSGPVRADIALKAEGFQGQAAYIDGLDSVISLNGQMQSSDKAVLYTGPARWVAQADHVQTGTIDARDIGLVAPSLTLLAGWSSAKGPSADINGPVSGHLGLLRQDDLFVKDAQLELSRFKLIGDSAGGDLAFRGNLTAQRLAAGDLSLEQTQIALNGKGDLATTDGAYHLSFTSDISSDRGQYLGLGAMAADRRQRKDAPKDTPTDGIVMLDRAFQRFSLRAKGVSYSLSGAQNRPSRFDLHLREAVRVALNGGGHLTLGPDAKPVLASDAPGAFAIDLGGAQIPQMRLKVDQFGFDPHNPFILSGLYNLSAAFDIEPLTGAQVAGKGRFTLTDQNVFLVTLDGPARLTARAAELGDHLENVAVMLTQRRVPFFRYDPLGWHVSGDFADLSLTAPNEQLSFTKANGLLEAFDVGGLNFRAILSRGELSDALTGASARFHPLYVSGTMSQDTRVLTGRFIAATPARLSAARPLNIAAIDLDQNLATATGSLSFRTLDLTFTPDGLQPADLSPLGHDILSRDVSGKVNFTGAFNWRPTESKSGGILTTDGLDFSGMGGVTQGLKTRMVFNSLAPLTTGPGQIIHVDRQQLAAPVFTDLNFAVQILADHMGVESALLQSVGGPVTLEPMSVPFDSKAAITGAVAFKGLDFGQIIAASDLKDSVRFEGRLSGRLPFYVQNGQVSIVRGVMASDGPGRIAIKRTDITAVKATGQVTATTQGQTTVVTPDPVFNPFQDMAFQALEHIAYEQIDAKLNSAADGVLETNFHIKGHYDPPEAQKATVSIVDYLSGKWMTKPIKLPSDTPIELFLDVPLRLDGVLSNLFSKTGAPAGTKSP